MTTIRNSFIFYLQTENSHFKPPLITAEQKFARNVLSMIFQDEFDPKINNRWSVNHIRDTICQIADIEFEAFLKIFKIFKEQVAIGKDPKILIKIINEHFLNIAKENSLNASDATKKRKKPKPYKLKNLKKIKIKRKF